MELRISSVWAFVRFYGKFLRSFFLSTFLLPEVDTNTAVAYLTNECGSWIF